MGVFGIQIEAFSLEDAVAKGGWIVTANPEILLYAKRHAEYREIIKKADQRTADGFGLWAILRLKGQKAHRVTGVEMSERLLQYATAEGLRVGMLGGEFGEAEEAAKGIRDSYPELKLHVEQGGRVSVDGVGDEIADEAMQRLQQFGPQILLVAFGHPRQEAWIARHRNDFPELKTVIGVGGTFNFWAGKSKRAPRWMRQIGLEWLWRLILEPKRCWRIFDAVFVFPFAALFE